MNKINLFSFVTCLHGYILTSLNEKFHYSEIWIFLSVCFINYLESKIGNEYMRSGAKESILDTSINVCFAP